LTLEPAADAELQFDRATGQLHIAPPLARFAASRPGRRTATWKYRLFAGPASPW
jgi:hypothetical protein